MTSPTVWWTSSPVMYISSTMFLIRNRPQPRGVCNPSSLASRSGTSLSGAGSRLPPWSLMRTDRSAPEESTSITTGTSDRYRLPCSMAFIVASATAVLSLSRRCSERPSPFTTAATLSIARRSFPGSLDTLNFARTRQVPLRPFCSTRLGAVTILPLSEASPEVMLSSCSQTPPTKRLRRTCASCLLPAHEPRPQPDRLGARSGGNRQPVDQAENCRNQTTDNAGRNHPKRDLRPFAVSREQVNNVEDDRGREQP